MIHLFIGLCEESHMLRISLRIFFDGDHEFGFPFFMEKKCSCENSSAVSVSIKCHSLMTVFHHKKNESQNVIAM